MFYTIYVTTNKVNGKKYIGKHATSCLEDDYIGSGLVLNKAIKKYGRNNFTKEIIHVFDNETEMNDKEIELVTIDVVLDPLYYNCALGGRGGVIVLKEDHPLYNSTRKKISDSQTARRSEMSSIVKDLHKTKAVGMYGKKQSEHQRRVVSELNKGKPKSEEQKKKHKDSLQKRFADPHYVHPNKGRIKEKFKCELCGTVVGGKTNYIRYHGNNCKNKENK